MSLSVKEFHMWLQGVEEMQDEGWVPDARQWAKIREKIGQLTVEAAQERPPLVMNGPTPRGQGMIMEAPPVASMPVTEALPQSFAIPSTNPMALSGPRMTSPSIPLAVRDGIAVATPNIDTSKGSYDSTFV